MESGARVSLLAATLGVALLCGIATAGVRLTQEEALALAFPAGTTTTRDTQFLKPADLERASQDAGSEVKDAMVVRYVGRKDGARVGTAYFDRHVIRSLPETVMVVVGTDGHATRVEVLAFDEPGEYLPKSSWYSQFGDQELNDGLTLTGRIRPVAGATLTARATTAAVRRVLALHRVIEAGVGKKPPK